MEPTMFNFRHLSIRSREAAFGDETRFVMTYYPADDGTLAQMFEDGSGVIIPWGDDYTLCKDKRIGRMEWANIPVTSTRYLTIWHVADLISFVCNKNITVVSW